MDYTKTFPDYKDKSILNLISAFREGKGEEGFTYKPLQLPIDKQVSDYDNVVFLVIDGLGYNYLQRRGEGTFLMDSLKDRLSTVFPTTTASAITSYLTGVSPSEHCLTGWFTYVKELATATTILTFSPRYSKFTFNKCGVDSKDVFHFKGLADKIEANFYHISSQHIIDTPFALSHSGNADRIGYSHISEIPALLSNVLKQKDKKKFIFMYISTLDKTAHEFGINSNETYNHLKYIDKLVADISAQLKPTNTLFIASADHGFLDSDPEKIIYMADHPEMASCLLMPLMGEPRVPYCYVRPARVEKFLKYMADNFSDFCEVKTADEMIQEGWFGPAINNPALYERVGDYILMLKDNYVFQDNLPVETKITFNGYHGGSTAEEMYVPLLIFNS
ncbi:MAG: alkaline phosphatase family protein [Candidatus Zophobacter franzmannii]|nr:alkaline phosphatase family protein [Candidatus Zophobacter franzmannii]